MTGTLMRAARRRRILLFAALVALGADLAYSAAPDLSLTPAALTFKYQSGAALPASQTVQIKSTGAALSFTISITGQPYSARWLSVSADSGTTTTSIKVYVNPTGLPSGSYSGKVVVNAPAAATPQHSVDVTLDVGDPAPTLTASPATLPPFTYVSGGAVPASQPIVLMTSGGALNASITLSGGSWLKASPSGSIALVGLPATVDISVDPTGLAPGSYDGKVTFTSTTAANKSVTVAVKLNVSAGVPTIAGIWPPGVLVNSPATTVTITGTNYFSTSVANIGTKALATTVLSPTTMLATVPPELLTTADDLDITVSTLTATAASQPATFTVYGPGPQIWAVADAASYSIAGISPGEIVTIYGVGLGPDDLAVFPGTSPLPASLPATGPATSVTIDGTAAPLLYTSASQVNCIVPYAVAAKAGNKVDVVLTYNSTPSSKFAVNVVDANPGVFTVDSSGVGQGAILNFNPTTNDYTVNGTSNPAAKGSTVALYVTGFGQTTPAGDETQLIGSTTPVVPAVIPTVTIGGQPAALEDAAAPAGSVPGLMLIKCTVPSAAASGKAVPVEVSVGTAKSQARVTMAIK